MSGGFEPRDFYRSFLAFHTEPLRSHTEPFRSTCPEPGSALGMVREERGGLERTEAPPLQVIPVQQSR